MSLRRATILTLATLLTFVAVLAGLASYWIAGQEANEFLDLQLRQVALLAGNAETVPGGMPPHDSEDDFVVEIRFGDGRPDICAPAACRFQEARETGFSETDAGAMPGGSSHWRCPIGPCRSASGGRCAARWRREPRWRRCCRCC